MAKAQVILGLRYSNSDYTYAVLKGSKNAPKILTVSNVSFPKGFNRAQILKWLLQEIESVFQARSISLVVVKRFEGRSKGNSFEERVECEATAYIAAANNGIKAVYKKVNRTIAKDLGLKGTAKALRDDLDTSPIPNFDKHTAKEQDAILSAWSELQ